MSGSGLDPEVLDGLGADLRAADYTTAGVAALLGEQAEAALGRGVWWPALHVTRTPEPDRRRLAVLVSCSCWAPRPHDHVAAAFPNVGVQALAANGVLEPTGQGTVRAVLDIRPHSDGARDFLVISDQDAVLRSAPVRRDHVLGIGGASVSLARAVIRTPVARALDLGTGCGIRPCTWLRTATRSWPPTPTNAPWRWPPGPRGSTV